MVSRAKQKRSSYVSKSKLASSANVNEQGFNGDNSLVENDNSIAKEKILDQIMAIGELAEKQSASLALLVEQNRH